MAWVLFVLLEPWAWFYIFINSARIVSAMAVTGEMATCTLIFFVQMSTVIRLAVLMFSFFR